MRDPDTHGSALNAPKERQRASQACEGCRKRKVRCDLATRNPCSNCFSRKKPCLSATLLNPTHGLSGSDVGIDLHTTAQDGVRNQHHAVAEGHSMRPPPDTYRRMDMLVSEAARALGEERGGHNDLTRSTHSPSSTITPQPVHSVDDEIWARNLEQVGNGGQDTNTVTEQSTSPTGSSVQQSPAPARKRVKFGSELLAHSVLPHMDGHSELLTHQTAAEVDRKDLQQLLPPAAGHPLGKAPWIHADCQAHLEMLAHLPPDERYYLYNMKKVFKFPQRSVTDKLVQIFFRWITPYLPIVDRRETVRKYHRLYAMQLSSPLLFHSILFCACPFADESLLADAGFSNTTEAKTYFFRRAKALYTYDCEPDQVVVVQSLVLLSFWWMDYTEEKDMKYYLNCAVNLALSMGMHRTVSKSLHLSPARRRLWRRLFWSVYCRAQNVALALGQPFPLRLSDCDLMPLSEEDFDEGEEEGEDGDEAVASACYDHFFHREPLPCHIHVALKQVEITARMEKLILSLQDIRRPQEALRVLQSARDIARRDIVSSAGIASDGFLIDDASSWNESNVFAVFLHLNHERFVTFYHRRRERALLSLQRMASNVGLEQPDSPSWAVLSFEDAPTSTVSDLVQGRADIVASAERVAQMIDDLRTRSLLRYAPSFVNTTTFHALLTLAEEIISSLEGTSRHSKAKTMFRTLLEGVGELRKYWPAASWCYSMYSHLELNEFEALRASAEKAKTQSRLQSHAPTRGPSRVGTPLPSGDGLATHDIDFLDPVLYLNETLPFAFDSLADWETFGSEPYVSAFD